MDPSRTNSRNSPRTTLRILFHPLSSILYPRKPIRLALLPLLLILAGCQGDDLPAEQPTFTREQPDFTTDRTSSDSSAIRFTDITEAAGIDFVHETGAFGQKWMPETLGSGGGFLNYDNDDWPDLFLVNSTTWLGQAEASTRPTPRLYRNRGDGTFEDVTVQAGLAFSLYGMGTAFADFDADGDTDIYITAVGDNRLLRNDGGRFTDITAAARVTGNSGRPGDAPAWSMSAAWVDFDRDGWLDLFVANYVRWTPETDIYVTRDGKTKSYATPQGYQGETSRLYRNINGRSFEDVTEKAGLLNDEGKSLGVAVADFNDDGWPDLFVANDTQPNFLYINQGDGAFVNEAIQAGVGYDEIGRARAGMGLDVADIRNDGRLAVAIGNFSLEPVSLYTQIGGGILFQDQAGAARLTGPSLPMLTFGLLFADLDLDGYLDLLAANGHIEPEINAVQENITFRQKPQVFHNNRGQFVDVSDQAGPAFAEPIVARGIATADIDRDGDLDVLLTVNGGAAKLLRNDVSAPKAHWVRLLLRGAAPNREALGALVTLWSNGMSQERMVRTGSSYLSQSEVNPILFGLGDATQADSVLVRWPTSGKVSRVGALPAGETHVVTEGASS